MRTWMGLDQTALNEAALARIEPGSPVAIIDIGSNSVRLVAYSGISRAPTPLYNEKVLCGLGRNVLSTGRLNEEAVRRALQALARFRVLCEAMHVGQVFVLATAAARDAENGPAFLEAAQAACGHPIELLSAGARRSCRPTASSRGSTRPTAWWAISAAAASNSSTCAARRSAAA